MPDTARRSELADAAIATLARDGSRGLTHRAVDRAAGLPESSTSFYFRSRLDLLRAAVRRLAELDAADIPTLPQTNERDFAVAFTGVVEHLLTDGRNRQLARYQLTSRRPVNPNCGTAWPLRLLVSVRWWRSGSLPSAYVTPRSGRRTSSHWSTGCCSTSSSAPADGHCRDRRYTIWSPASSSPSECRSTRRSRSTSDGKEGAACGQCCPSSVSCSRRVS